MKNKRASNPSRLTKEGLFLSLYQSLLVIALTILAVVFVGKAVASPTQGDNILGTTTYLAKGDDENKNEDKVEKKREEEKKEEVRVESRGGETRIELRQKTDGDKTRVKQEIRTENGRIKFEVKDGETKVKIERKTGQPQQEFEVSSKSSELAEIESSEEEKFKIKIRVRDGGFELKAKGATALTNFPLSFNPETNELSVTTPKGTILIKTLPQVAVQNILASNVMDRVLGQDSDADEDDIEDIDIEDEKATEVKVEGFVESLTVSQIAVSGVTFTINSATKFEETITVGSGVKVKGNPQNGTLVARKVELEDEVELKVKIEGVVESVTEDTIIVSGITFTRSPATRIEGNLALGQQVEIKGAPAAGGILLANKIDVEASGKGLVLAEENGEAVFKIKGQKDARFLNIFPVTLPVEATISVETGKVLSVSNPFLLNILGFLFRT